MSIIKATGAIPGGIAAADVPEGNTLLVLSHPLAQRDGCWIWGLKFFGAMILAGVEKVLGKGSDGARIGPPMLG